jgi:hypothetical protein
VSNSRAGGRSDKRKETVHRQRQMCNATVVIASLYSPVTVAERSKACTVFALSEAWIMGSHPTQGMDVRCVYVFILFVVSCV